ncbi:hypothetical protein B484DRAFT_211863 [Ochromonadaceae sp. CCMP2298]|nr:hypothetical protein B484DRAFT_211863 [Ochromonadaceae sp. CCMP2298]
MNAVGAYDDQLICDLQACKAHLFQSVSGSSSLFYLKKEHAKMKKSFDHAFKYKLSTSLIIVGDSGDEVLLLIRSVLDSYKNEAISSNGGRFSKLKNYTARVSGSTQLSDHEALVDMANQFMVRNEKDSNVNLALEDLEDLFTHCRQDGVPAIIVLEDFHVFAQRQRQTLIYTLLDLMHKKELLFMIVGVTDHADVNTRLEKRVISRLNAQYVFLPCASGLDICESLSKMFALPETEDGAREGGGGVGGPGRGVSRAFAVQFNAQVHSLFGTYSRSVIEAEAKAEPGADSGAEAEAEGGGSDQEEDAISEANFEAGRILPLMQIHREWGRGIE